MHNLTKLLKILLICISRNSDNIHFKNITFLVYERLMIATRQITSHRYSELSKEKLYFDIKNDIDQNNNTNMHQFKNIFNKKHQNGLILSYDVM